MTGQAHLGVLQAGPIGEVAVGVAVQDLQRGLAALVERASVARIDVGDPVGPLLTTAARRKKLAGQAVAVSRSSGPAWPFT
ncbi:hypothetical protein ACRAWD_12250 [Caulobacter segnis]